MTKHTILKEKTQFGIDWLKMKLHVNMDNSFAEALELTQKENKKRTS